MSSSRRIHEWEERSAEYWPGAKIWWYEETTSTMDLARAHVGAVRSSEVGLVAARSQSGGRGRRGRSWIPPEAGFFGTFITPSTSGVQALSGFSLVVGCAAARALESLGASTLLKWPNDILTRDGKKLGGILVEVVQGAEGVVALTGIGINLAGASSSLPESAALDSILSGEVPPLPVFAAALGRRFEEALRTFQREGFSAFREEWLGRGFGVGEDLLLKTGEGEVAGVFTDIGMDGALRLRVAGEIRSFHVGEVVLARTRGRSACS